jgi:hypothetical protein
MVDSSLLFWLILWARTVDCRPSLPIRLSLPIKLILRVQMVESETEKLIWELNEKLNLELFNCAWNNSWDFLYFGLWTTHFDSDFQDRHYLCLHVVQSRVGFGQWRICENDHCGEKTLHGCHNIWIGNMWVSMRTRNTDKPVSSYFEGVREYACVDWLDCGWK